MAKDTNIEKLVGRNNFDRLGRIFDQHRPEAARLKQALRAHVPIIGSRVCIGCPEEDPRADLTVTANIFADYEAECATIGLASFIREKSSKPVKPKGISFFQLGLITEPELAFDGFQAKIQADGVEALFGLHNEDQIELDGVGQREIGDFANICIIALEDRLERPDIDRA